MEILEKNIDTALTIISKLNEDCLVRNKIKSVNIIYDKDFKPEINITYNSGYNKKLKELDKILEFIKTLR